MKSMTGYGTANGKVGRGLVFIEIKTVNHRYCDVSPRVPPRMTSVELKLRDLLQKRLVRGKVECYLKEVEPIFGDSQLVVNTALAKKYQSTLEKLKKALKTKGHQDLLDLVGLDRFIQVKEGEGDYAKTWSQISQVTEKALAQVERMRSREGGELLADQRRRINQLTKELAVIERRSNKNTIVRKSAAAEQHANGNSEASRSTDKMDITEELIRLKSHVKQYAGLLGKKEEIGRKLDFLIQEMHREVNTIGAKASDASISSHIVESKSLLENLREQVQNIL